MKTTNEIEIIIDIIVVKGVWGGQKVETSATAKIKGEYYKIIFERNQLTGTINRVECLEREERTTTENTLTKETVCDLVYDEIS